MESAQQTDKLEEQSHEIIQELQEEEEEEEEEAIPNPTKSDNIPVKEAPNTKEPEKNSSWGWGSFWNAASTVVTQSVDQYVKPTLNTVSETTSQLVRDLISDGTEAKSSTPIEDEKQEEGILEKSLANIGNYLNDGLKSVKTEELAVKAKELQQKALELAAASVKKAKEATSTATENTLKFGEVLASQSIDTLEAVGKSALEFLTVQEVLEGKQRIRPVFLSAQKAHMTEEEQENFEKVLNRNYFEECNGIAYMQALETLSIESTLKVQKLEQDLDEKQREELSALLSVIKDLLDLAEQGEVEQVQLPDIKLNEPAIKQNKNVEVLENSSLNKVKELTESFKKEILELIPDQTATSIITANDICHLTASYLDKTLLESVQRVNQFSASGIEQLLRSVESFFIDLDYGMKPKEALDKSTYILNLTMVLINKLNIISTWYVECVQKISEDGQSDCSQYGKKDEKAFSEAKKCVEDIGTKMSLHCNHIYLETSNAISYIEDCRKFLFSISKSLLVSSIGGTQNVVEISKEEEPTSKNSTQETEEKGTL